MIIIIVFLPPFPTFFFCPPNPLPCRYLFLLLCASAKVSLLLSFLRRPILFLVIIIIIPFSPLSSLPARFARPPLSLLLLVENSKNTEKWEVVMFFVVGCCRSYQQW